MKTGFYIAQFPAGFADNSPLYGAFEWRAQDELRVTRVRQVLSELEFEIPDAHQIDVFYHGRTILFDSTDLLSVNEEHQIQMETGFTPIEITETEFLQILSLSDEYRTDCWGLEIMDESLFLICFGKWDGMKYGTTDLGGL